jgi:hypothetical protein
LKINTSFKLNHDETEIDKFFLVKVASFKEGITSVSVDIVFSQVGTDILLFATI